MSTEDEDVQDHVKDEEFKRQQDELIQNRQETIDKEIAEVKESRENVADSTRSVHQEETYKDLLEMGFSAAEILNLIDAVISNRVRHVHVSWLDERGGK